MLDATPLLKLYAHWRRRRMSSVSPAEMQRRQLLGLLRHAASTRFGTEHGFAGISTVAQFQDRVPLRRYEDFWEAYWRDTFPNIGGTTWPDAVPYFALTSGTSTGRTKYIPVSRQMLRSNRKAGLDVLVHHLANRPHSRILGGRQFMLSGSVALETVAPGVFSGDLTAIATQESPSWIRPMTFPPSEIAREPSWQHKIERLAECAPDEDIRNIAGTASWLLMFFDELTTRHPGERRLARFFPALEMVVHGGVSFAPYRDRFESWLAGSYAELREVYPASEGFVAIADRATGEGLRLNLDHGLFFEFVPVEELEAEIPTRHWVADAEVGQDYAVVVTTCAGLWAHVVGDIVRFVDRDPPRILVTGRTSYYLSTFGEHLTGEEISDAVLSAVAASGASVAEFSVGTVFDDPASGRGGHLFVIEPVSSAEPPPQAQPIAAAIDERLSAANDDYRAHRAGDFGMSAPRVVLVAPGTFALWMRERGKLGGQNKVPRVVNDPSLLDSLRHVAENNRLSPVP